MTEWKKNTVHPLRIEGYTAEGMGVARLEGRVVCVPFTAQGEFWRVRLEKVRPHMAWGRGVELLEGSGEAAETRRQQADQLVTALEGRDELALLEASMLLEKIPKEELPRLLDQVIAALGARLPQSEAPRRLLRAAELVQKLRGAAELNANPGQLSGWLCAAMFIKH